MRYFNVQDIIFTNAGNEQFLVKDMREFPDDYEYRMTVSTGAFKKLDLIAAMETAYKDESQSYKIMDYNKVDLVNNFFDLEKMKRIKIAQ